MTYEPINITWTQQGSETYNWTIPSEAVESFQKWIDSQTTIKPVETTDDNGNTRTEYQSAPKYSGIGAAVIDFMTEALVKPIFRQFPPAALADLKAQAEAAQKAMEEAQAQAATQFLQAQ